jgi:FkbH-like protein
MKLENILELNQKIKFPKSQKKIKIALISNITVNIFKYFIEYNLKKKGLNVEVHVGEYNNLIQNAYKFKNFDIVVIFYEFINIYENVEKIKDIQNLINIKKNFLKDLNLSLKILKNCPLKIVNDFNHFYISPKNKLFNNFIKVTNNLNQFILNKKNSNIHIIKLNNFFKNFDLKKFINKKNYQYSKTLYNSRFMQAYAEKITLPILSINGKPKKALILDCDNTLWSGVIGEDSNISKKKNWKLFVKVQTIYKNLKKKGLILCLCSKNNFNDVRNFFNTTKMPLKFTDFTIKKINWNNKVNNIKEISKELNIGLDSFIFIDDSSFEIGSVKQYLKNVDCIQVPKKDKNYLFKIENLEHDLSFLKQTREDKIRMKSYEQERKRISSKDNFKNINEYIKSLNIKINYKNNNKISIHRASQITQRTNQFNLTTLRYSENDIRKFIKNKNILITEISVKDKYGEYGITGLSIVFVNKKDKTASIDTFALSCRVLGRGVENEYLSWILKELKKIGIVKVYSKFVKSQKNDLVKNFYDKNKFKVISSNSTKKNYVMDLKKI